MYEHVPIFHFIVMGSTPPYTLCALTSHHRVRCSSAFKQLVCLSVRYVTQNTEVREDKILLRAYPESRAYGTGVGARRGN